MPVYLSMYVQIDNNVVTYKEQKMIRPYMM